MATDIDKMMAKIYKGMPDLLGIPHRSRFILIIVLAGAFLYYMLVIRRRK